VPVAEVNSAAADECPISHFDVGPTGGRVLALLPAGGGRQQQSPNQVTIRLNAADEVRRGPASMSTFYSAPETEPSILPSTTLLDPKLNVL
jgi:hypothetical protein